MNRKSVAATLLIGLGAALAAGFGASPAAAADLKVTITGVPIDTGALMIGLYQTPAAFASAIKNSSEANVLKDTGRLVGVTMRARAGSQSIGFMDLPPGRYAVIVFHDQNDNGLLDEDMVGAPTEPYGFSNNATGFLSAPSFDASAIKVEGDTEIAINLHVPATPQVSARPTK